MYFKSPNNCRLFLFLLTYILLASQPMVQAQDNTANFDHISVEDGLSQSEVYAILKDSQGFMWFGTVDGLNKYNGYNFIHYKHDPYDTTTLSHNHINTLYEDKSGNLWAGTFDGLNKLDKKTNTFVRLNHISNPKTSPVTVTSIYEDRFHTIWVGTSQGLKRLIPQGNKGTYNTRTYANDSTQAYSLSHNWVNTIFEDKKGNIWVGTARGLNLLTIKDPSKKPEQQQVVFTHAYNSNNPVFNVSYPSISGIAEDHFGNLWVATSRGLNRIDTKAGTVECYYHQPGNHKSLSDNVIEALLVDQKGDIWVGTQANGICKLILKDKETVSDILHYKDDFSANKGLKSNMIYYLYESSDENEDVVWIGTRGAGVHTYSRSKNKFVLWNRITGQDRSSASNSTFAIFTDQTDHLWIGTQRGIYRINRKNNKVSRYLYDPNNIHSISDDLIQHIYEDKQGNIWVGTHFGLNKFDAATETFTRIYFNDHGKKYLENKIVSMYDDHAGNLWIGTGLDLKKYDRKTGKTYSYHTMNGSRNFRSMFITCINEDKENNLWLGTLFGLYKFNPVNGTFKPYLHKKDDPHSLNSDMVWSTMLDEKGIFWISTDQGINKMIIKNGKEKFLHYNQKNGLSNNFVYGMVTDSKGMIWMSSNLGLSRFNPTTQTFKNFDVTDGLPNNEFNSGAYHKSAKGELFFAGNSGAVSFDPETIADNLHIPKVQITSFKKFEKPLNLDSLLAAEGAIKLNFKENFFSFDFVALDYTNPRKNQYAFKMDGFHDEWIYVGNRRFASFTNLSPGTYTFRVKGSNSDGIWNEKQEASIQVIITPPFWRTYWFYILTLLILVASARLFYDYRVKRKVYRLMEMEKVKLAENERVRKLAAEDLHDEFGNRLTRISLLTELIKARLNGHGAEVSDLLTKISDNSNQLYQGTKDFIWSINPDNDSMYEAAIRLKDFGDDLFDKTATTFNASGITEALKPVMLPMGDSRHLILLFKEAMSNILKHAKSKHVQLQFEIKEGRVTVSLTDDGIGFEKERERAGNGLMNMQSRAKKLNGKLNICSSVAAGTKISFSLPAPQLV